MQEGFQSSQELAASITKAASKQTYCTIRFLVDRQRVSDAYRAYTYFRLIDDRIDQVALEKSERVAFIGRQKAIMDAIERMNYRLAPEYMQSRGLGTGIRMRGTVLSFAIFPLIRR